MSLIDAMIIVSGLMVFEIVSSVDNAVVNADILKHMGRLWRGRFLTIGMVVSVFVVRFLLPLAIIWISVQGITLGELMQSFTGGSSIGTGAIEHSKPIILIFGGMFLLYLYIHWLLTEKKEPLFIERFVAIGNGKRFLIISSIVLAIVMYLARHNPSMVIATAIGGASFLVLYKVRTMAEKKEGVMSSKGMSGDFSKFMYLSFLDATFSFDGVIGAFAFTINLLMIVIGLGIGAWVVRSLTIRGIDSITKYRWLKNGALTSIGLLGIFMIMESFGLGIPFYLPTATTLAIVGIAFYKSSRLLKKRKN